MKNDYEGKYPESKDIVNETISQIVSEDYLKVDTSDMDGVRAAVDSFYAYEKKPGKKKAMAQEPLDPEQAIRKSVDEKIIIRSEELKKKRKTAKKPGSAGKAGSQAVSAKTRKPGKKRAAASARRDSFRHAKGLEKYRKMGVLPTKKNGPSEFRKKSADWRYEDVAKAPVTDEAIEEEIRNESFGDRLRNMSAVQWMCAVMAAAILITSVMTTTVYADYRGEINKANAIANLPQFMDDASMIAYEPEDIETSDVEMEDAAAGAESVEGKMLSLVLTSVEKDLKVKLVDDEDTLVKGIKWGITVTDDKDNASEYEDEDEDGIIHLTGISAGDYSVSITDSDSLDGFVYPTVGQKVSVKAKVEYKVIANIKDEIKKESEVNAAAEDNGNKAADVETGPVLTDTVEFVESTREENGETYEEAQVDLSKTEIIASVRSRIVGALETVADSVQSVFANNGIAALRMMPRMVAVENTENTSEEDAAKKAAEEEETKRKADEEAAKKAAEEEEAKRKAEEEKKAAEEEEAKRKTEEEKKKAEEEEAKRKAAEEEEAKRKAAEEEEAKRKAEEEKKKAEEEKSKHTHNYSKTITKEPTCTEKGVATYKCECGETYTEEIDALGHNYENGKCTRCGQLDPELTPTPTPTPTPDGEYKPEAQLYDSAKNELYVRENDEYRLAKYADYKSGNFSVYYRKVIGYVYTGWQNIDGRTYYYTKDHEKVTGEQIIGGVSYVFNEDGSLDNGSGTLGIDVSKYQPSINWESVKASGVDFVIVRCGYRGASTGALIEDPYFRSHIKGAKSVGLKVGVYFFSTALSEAEAVEEASMCAELCSGYGLSYPVFLDVESSSRPGYNTLSASDRTANIKAFCQTIASAGYTPGLYANKTWLSEKINTGSLSCKIWLAQYRSEGPTYSGRYDIWQYTSKGHVDGISGNVDMNKSFLK